MGDKFLSYTAEKRAKVQKQMDKLKDELSKLDEAERLYRASGAAPQEPQLFESQVIENVDSLLDDANKLLAASGIGAYAGHGTIKQRVLSILGANTDGLTSGQILERLNLVGSTVTRESLSPQLTRLRKDDKLIDLNQLTGIWFLK